MDYGDVRTGMALSDSARTVASGLCTVQGGMRKTAEAVAQTVRERGAVAVVVGLPVNMDGSHGPPRGARGEICAGIAASVGRNGAGRDLG